MAELSLLQKLRTEYKPPLPRILSGINDLAVDASGQKIGQQEAVGKYFPQTREQKPIKFKQEKNRAHKTLKVGVVLSGGQASGGHNVISGLYDALKKINAQSKLIGFKNGPSGILKNDFVEITDAILVNFRNQGGFDLIGSGRTKIETDEQFQMAEKTIRDQHLDGLVIIGGDDSNTNAALLAEYCKAKSLPCSVVGVPKTIDGDLKNEFVEVSFGFDSACKVYSEIIGNILRDNLSAKKYYYFIKLMGRSASHVALECALQTHPNLTFIGEEVEKEKKTVMDLVKEIADLVCARAEKKKDFGVILIPEGIVEFIPEMKQLIKELNYLLTSDKPHQKKMETFSSKNEAIDYIMKFLGTESVHCFKTLPKEIQQQLLLDRDPHGNVQVSKIETERLFMEMVEDELEKRKSGGVYSGKFSTQPLFCGYEGRSGLPSNFDANYCYALGHVAALLIDNGASGYMTCVNQLNKTVEDWEISGVPLVSMMTMEVRGGKEKPVVKKALVELDGKPFSLFKQQRQAWMLNDDYRFPGPIQFFGPKEVTDALTITLQST